MTLLDEARALVGLDEDDPRYWHVVAPGSPEREASAVAHAVSSCMLVAAYLRGWRGPFVSDTIQTTLRGLGPWRVPDVDAFCEPGAALWWAAAGPHVEHVDAAVLSVERHSLYAVTVTVVAGGQRVGGRRGIAELERRCAWDGAGWVDEGTGRRARWVLDAGEDAPETPRTAGD